MIGIKCEVCGEHPVCKKGCKNEENVEYYQLFLSHIKKFTDTQLASVGFEVWVEARERSGIDGNI